MTDEQKDTYIELLENYRRVVTAARRKQGYSLEGEYEAIKAIEAFEDSLPCNQEENNV